MCSAKKNKYDYLSLKQKIVQNSLKQNGIQFFVFFGKKIEAAANSTKLPRTCE